MRLAIVTAIATACLAASASGAKAQSTEELRLPETLDRSFREMMQDLKPALDGTLDTIGPALERALQDFGPALEGAADYLRGFDAIGDPRHYEAPEILPNGDIIIRRRQDAPPVSPEAPATPGALPPDDGPGVRT